MPEDAERNAVEAARLIAEQESGDAAADYLAEAQHALSLTGATAAHWRMASLGLRHISPKRRDLTWARLAASDLVRREAEDPDNPGLPMPSPIRDEVNAILYAIDYGDSRNIWITAGPGAVPRIETRAHALDFVRSELEIARRSSGSDLSVAAMVGAFWVGDLRGGVDMWGELARNHERQGAVALSVMDWSTLARNQYALGDISAGDAALQRALAAAARLPTAPNWYVVNYLAAEDDRRAVTGDWSGAQETINAIAGQQVIENRWAGAAIFAGVARAFAMFGQPDGAMGMLAQVIAPLERAPGDAANFPRIACNAAEVLWVTGRRDHIEVVERALREKVVGPDIRYVNVDGRLALAWLCALTGRYDEASEWFAKARAVLEEQGARPLRAICDHDEALMFVRRNAEGDRERALPLLDAALEQFREIGMTGWVARGEELRAQIAGTSHP
jgi:tetratricopeptide (TPR) repeat protein